MKSRVPVSPELQPLDQTHAPDIAETVSPAVDIGPDHVHIKVINEVLPPDVALEPDGAFDGGEDVLQKS